MSIASISWVFGQDIRPSHTKFVLLAIADFAGDDGIAYPSVETLANKCSQDRKTVIDSLDELENLGLLRDTGERKGATGQVKVYQMIGLPSSDSHYVYRLESDDGEFYIGVRSCFGTVEGDDYMGSGKWPKLMRKLRKPMTKKVIGSFQTREEAEAEEARIIRDLIKDSRCRNSIVPYKQYRLRMERVPSTDGNSTVDGRKESRTRYTEPLVNHQEPLLTSRFAPPSVEEVKTYCQERKNGIDPQAFVDHYQASGWIRGKTKIKDWRACVRTWEKNKKDKEKPKLHQDHQYAK
jgi:hypothetical protein